MAVYEPGSLARRDALAALAAQRRAYRVVYNSSSLAGQIAAVESGLAVAVLTRCSVPPGLLVLQRTSTGLPALGVDGGGGAAQQGLARTSPAVDALHDEALRTLLRSPGATRRRPREPRRPPAPMIAACRR